MSVRNAISGRKILLMLGTSAVFLALLLQPDTVTSAVTRASESFCIRLVPVLFPYMVLSHFFCTYSLLDPLDALIPAGKLFGMGKGAFPVFLMGHLCGYPVGAKMAAETVRQGRLSKNQGAILCAVSSGASPAFLLYTAGGACWNDVHFGVFLLGIQVLSGCIGGMVLGRSVSDEGTHISAGREEVPFSRCFCEAVGGSALQLVSIGGYIVFFSLLVEILPFPGETAALGAAFLEFSTGTRLAAETGGMKGLFCTGFAAGFGGISVLAQTSHMLSGSGISLKPYVGYKLVSGMVCGISAMVYGLAVPDILMQQSSSAVVLQTGEPLWMAVFCGMLGMMWYFPGDRQGQER